MKILKTVLASMLVSSFFVLQASGSIFVRCDKVGGKMQNGQCFKDGKLKIAQ